MDKLLYILKRRKNGYKSYIKTQELHGNNEIEQNSDYSILKELKSVMSRFLGNYSCPNCGGYRVDGNLIVEIDEVEFFEEVWKKGFFGKKL